MAFLSINEVYSELDDLTKRRLTPAAKDVLASILVESFTLREDEWLRKTQRLAPHEVTRSDVIIELRDVFRRLDLPYGEIDSLTLLRTIHEKWCRVWPFCK